MFAKKDTDIYFISEEDSSDSPTAEEVVVRRHLLIGAFIEGQFTSMQVSKKLCRYGDIAIL